MCTPNTHKVVEMPSTTIEMNLNKVKVERAPKRTQDQCSTTTSSKLKSIRKRCKSQKKETRITKTQNKRFKQGTRKQNLIAMDLMQCSTNTEWKFTNKQSTKTNTMLPNVYPSHFKYQLPPEAVLTKPLVTHQPGIMTPDLTQSCEWGGSSTSPSLPDSLRGLLETNDLKEFLNIESVTYRLQDCHVYALATVLNMRQESLQKLLDKIVAIDHTVLRKTVKTLKTPFKPDYDLFEKVSTVDSESPSDSVLNSQSPKMSRLFSARYKNKTS